MKFRTTTLLLAAALAIAPVARADSFLVAFSGSMGGSPTTLDATVNATNQGNGSYLVTALDSFSYTYQGSTYNTATYVGSYGNAGDGLLYPGDTYNYHYTNCLVTPCVAGSGSSLLDWKGLLFNVSGTYVGLSLNFDGGTPTYDVADYFYLNADGSASYSNSFGSLTISTPMSATPEPSSWLLLLTGLLALLFVGRRRFGLQS